MSQQQSIEETPLITVTVIHFGQINENKLTTCFGSGMSPNKHIGRLAVSEAGEVGWLSSTESFINQCPELADDANRMGQGLGGSLQGWSSLVLGTGSRGSSSLLAC